MMWPHSSTGLAVRLHKSNANVSPVAEKSGDNFGPETNDDTEEIVEDKSKIKIDSKNLPQTIPRKVSKDMKLVIPIQPTGVNVVGYNECAIVWWKYNQDINNVKCWDINVYILSSGMWYFHTLVRVANEITFITQYFIEDLDNSQIYRFGVIARNLNGSSKESTYSPAVLIHEPLPAGWILFFEEDSRRFRYLNVKTQESSYTRPDDSPTFLDDTIRSIFRPVETRRLMKLFEDEIASREKITIGRIQTILNQLGESSVSRRLLGQAIRDVSTDVDTVYTLQAFMGVMYAAKVRALRESRLPHISFGIRSVFYRTASLLRYVRRHVSAADSSRKVVHWESRWSEALGLPYYRNHVTKTIRWDLPNEIRFYLSKAGESSALGLFSYCDLEAMKTHFASLDHELRGWVTGIDVRNLLLLAQTEALAPSNLITQTAFERRRFSFESFCLMLTNWLKATDESTRDSTRDRLLSHLAVLDVSGRRRSSNQAENRSSNHSSSEGQQGEGGTVQGGDEQGGNDDSRVDRSSEHCRVGKDDGWLRQGRNPEQKRSLQSREGEGVGSGVRKQTSTGNIGSVFKIFRRRFQIKSSRNSGPISASSSVVSRWVRGRKVQTSTSVVRLSVRCKGNVNNDELDFAHSSHCLCGCRARNAPVASLNVSRR